MLRIAKTAEEFRMQSKLFRVAETVEHHATVKYTGLYGQEEWVITKTPTAYIRML